MDEMRNGMPGTDSEVALERLETERREALRRATMVGLEQLRRGEGIPGEQVFEELRRMSEGRRHGGR